MALKRKKPPDMPAAGEIAVGGQGMTGLPRSDGGSELGEVVLKLVDIDVDAEQVFRQRAENLGVVA
jgi:hypothetical protein